MASRRLTARPSWTGTKKIDEYWQRAYAPPAARDRFQGISMAFVQVSDGYSPMGVAITLLSDVASFSMKGRSR